jgi:5-methylcytosine-specific restriction endonuclease McrA
MEKRKRSHWYRQEWPEDPTLAWFQLLIERGDTAAAQRQWRERNLDHARQSRREHYAENADRLRAYDRSRYPRRREKKTPEDRAKFAAYMRKRRSQAGAEGKAEAAAQMKRWRDKNAAHHSAYRRKHYAKNADAIKAAVKQWREDNHDEWLARHASHEARRRGAIGHFKRSDIEIIWDKQGGICVYCSADLAISLNIDHKTPVIRGGTNWPDNLQLLCESCNKRKHDKTDEEWRALIAMSG